MTRTLRDKTEAARRRHVLEAAARVFAARGFHRSTIREVAREAGVADGTIYNVFANKAALLDGLLEPLAESASVPPAPVGEGPAALLEALFARRWASFTPEVLAMLRPVLAEALVDSAVRAEMLARVVLPPITLAEPLIAAKGADGSLAVEDAAMTVRVLSAAMIGLVVLRLLGESEIERRADAIPGLLARLLAEGLRPRVDGPPEDPA